MAETEKWYAAKYRAGDRVWTFEQLVRQGKRAHGRPIWLEVPEGSRERTMMQFDRFEKRIVTPSQFRENQQDRHAKRKADYIARRRETVNASTDGLKSEFK